MLGSLIDKLHGPIVVLGGTGFIGGNLVRCLEARRTDVFWGARSDIKGILKKIKPKTVFNCSGCGNAPSATQRESIGTNFYLVGELLELAFESGCETFVHAGSAAEYGDARMGPGDKDVLKPSTLYGTTKAAASLLLWHYGKNLGKRVVNLRFYNVYGPGDKPSRLVSTIVREGKQGRLPNFANPNTRYDFVYVDDACRAFITAAVNLKKEHYGESFNIGGDCRTLKEVARYAKKIFKIEAGPVFDKRAPLIEWGAEVKKTEGHLDFKSEVSLEQGLKKMAGIKNAS